MASPAVEPLAVYFARRALANERQLKCFAITTCGVMAVFVVFCWARQLGARAVSMAPVGQRLDKATRPLRNVLARKVPGFASANHALLVVAFIAGNVAITFTNLTSTSLSTLASRFGWMATGNMCLLVFLGLKNTPLALWTTYSYERLNWLHQVAGYAMFTHMVLHAAMYTAFFAQEGELQTIFATREDMLGIVSGFAFASAVFAAMVVRYVRYELFYSMHVTMWMLGVIAVGIHQPNMGEAIGIVTLLSASMWLVDRAIRGARILGNSLNNEAILHPLTGGATRVLMKKVPRGAKAGRHFRLWIPSLRPLETHPFTVVSTSPLEFVIRAQDGFTRDLYRYAVTHPGMSVRASVDGPYGPLLSPLTFQKVVLVAGGAGATFTIGLAMGMLERMDESHETEILFIWVVQREEILWWLSEHLKALRTHAYSKKIKVLLHVTRAAPLDSQDRSDPENALAQETQVSRSRSAEKSGDEKKETPSIRVDHSEITGSADEKTNQGSSPTTLELGYSVNHERPHIASLIQSEFEATAKTHRMLVAACGPSSLLRVVRDATAKLLRGDGPGVELHCEKFGW